MKKQILITLAFALVLLAVAACSAAPTPTPVPPAIIVQPTALLQPPATTVPPTAVPQPTATTAPPTTAPTTSAAPSATTAATAAPTTAQATTVPPTIPPPSVAPTTAPASPSAPPGLYVTAMRLDPATPAHSQAISFFVTFSNTASTDNNQRWAVYIYKADNPTRRNNETTVLLTTFHPGSVELQSIGTYQIGPTGNSCDFFFARVVILDQNNKGIELTKTDGTVFEKGFTVCQ